MKTIETTIVVGTDRRLTVQLPPDITPGEHRVVLVLEQAAPIQRKSRPLRFSAYPVAPVSENMTFRREDLYDDDGR